MTPNDLAAAGARMSAALVRRMVDDLTPEEFVRQPLPGANCAAWVVGHLTLSMRTAMTRMGVDDLPAFPDGLAERVKQTREAAGVQAPEDYGEKAALLAAFDAHAERYQAAIKALPGEAFDAEPLVPSPLAKNRGEGILFGSLHIAMHSGQLSTIRRALGKPPLV
jgi:hypothetical protein